MTDVAWPVWCPLGADMGGGDIADKAGSRKVMRISAGSGLR